MANPIITQTTMAALLGRSLTTVESNNYDLYLKIAILRLEDLLCLTITAPLAEDLQLLLARCFGVIASEQNATAGLGIDTKRVEDFSVSFNADAETPMAAFVSQNNSTIAKYSECQAHIKTGETYGDRLYII